MKELFLLVISLALYFVAPENYNWYFCALCTLFFFIGAIFSVRSCSEKKDFFSFNIIFLFAYFWTSFAYPLFVFGTFRDRDNIINKYIDWSSLSQTTALALVFICAYFFGYANKKEKLFYLSGSFYRSISLKAPNSIFIIVSILYIGNAFFSFFVAGGVNLSTGKYLTDIFFTFLIFVTYANVNNYQKGERNFSTFISINKSSIVFSSLVFFFFIIVGDRGPAIKVVLTFFSIYCFYWKRIKLTKVTLIGVIFVCLLFFVRQTRAGNDSIVSGNVSTAQIVNIFDLENGNFYVFADLFYINRELNLGYEYSKTHDLFHPEKILLAPFYPFPVLPSVISQLFFGITPVKMDTGAELNASMMSLYGVETHFGNHPAGDLLMSFGLLGLIIISFLFGEIIALFERNRYSNFYTACCFITLMSWSLYLSRTSVLSIVRPLGYVYVLGYFIYRLNPKITAFKLKIENLKK